MNISHMLNINQQPDTLDNIYGEQDYYWYLRSDEFKSAFQQSIGYYANKLGKRCLDVGCGEGQLSEFIDNRYAGFDGSFVAIERGRQRYPKADLRVGRLEAPPEYEEGFDVIVFSGILEVLVLPEHRVNFVRNYLAFYRAKYFIVCDLLRLDESDLQSYFTCLSTDYKEAKYIDIESVKRFRKISVYQTCNTY